MLKPIRWLLLLLLGLSLPACFHLLWSGNSGFDRRQFTLQLLSLFDQRHTSATFRWRNDWIFRRLRLDMINAGLATLRPDLLIMQEVMSRKENSYDTDLGILRAGALDGYGTEETLIAEDQEAGSVESLAVASSLSFQLPDEKNRHGIWHWNRSVFGKFVAEFEGQDVVLFNVKMAEDERDAEGFYAFLASTIKQDLFLGRHCPQRLIVAGHFADGGNGPHFAAFLRELSLHDTATGYCHLATACHTISATNELLLATWGEVPSRRSARVLVHRKTIVYGAKRNFDQPRPLPADLQGKYGLQKLWPTRTFGWTTQLRLAKCEAPTEG